MLNRSRVSRVLDVARLGEALARPGMDPRTWVSYAIVLAYSVDPAHGPLARVKMLPGGLEDVARVAYDYAGNGFGLYAGSLKVDDEVLVAAPNGEPAAGLVVIRRLWSPADPPPQEAVDHPEDVLIHVEDGKTLRLTVSGGGRILLGGEDSAEAVPLGNTLVEALTELLTTGVLQSPVGPVFAKTSWVQKYLDDADTNILSQKAFTERGDS